jgi:hypothetical protein
MIQKIKVNPVHTPAAVDYSKFNFGYFSSSLAVVLHWMLSLKKAFGVDGWCKI